MTTEGEQQEAVCGTCGEDADAPQHDEFGHGASIDDVPMGDEHQFIPAPVVPSDDAPRREQYATSDEYRAAMVEWALSAPPTPSQDAEGDGLERAWAEYDEPGDDCNAYDEERHPRGCTCTRDERRAAVESAIREPYEELVKAEIARKAAERGMDTLDRTQRIIARRLLVDAEADIEAALTRIEESLGGRKDG